LQFDGQNDFVNLPVVLPPAPWTIEMWVHPRSLLDGTGAYIVKFNPAGTLLAQASMFKGLNVLQVNYNGGQVWNPLTVMDQFSTKTIKPQASEGLSYHLAVVKNMTDMMVFLNGEPAGSAALDPVADFAEFNPRLLIPWMLGGRMVRMRGQWIADDRNFGGILDTVRWWSVARTLPELQEFMTTPVRDSTPGLAHQWNFDEGIGEGGADSFVLGGGDPSSSPAWVPSPFPGHGGPVALATRVLGT